MVREIIIIFVTVRMRGDYLNVSEVPLYFGYGVTEENHLSYFLSLLLNNYSNDLNPWE
ncbi:MAG: hypothetical protein ABFC34_08560 [Methanobacterium sp.]